MPKPASAATEARNNDKAPVWWLQPDIQKKLLSVALTVYVIMVAYGIMNHELWRDEGCDWMAVRDLGLGDLLAWYIPQGGHPPLYYLILFPLAKMGLPLKTVNIVSLVFMTGALYLLLFKTKLPFFLKLGLVFSFFFLYEYAVIGRNYGVVVFFTALTIYIYPRRFERPWVYALILVCQLNADSLLFPFSMAIVLMYWVEIWQQKKLRPAYVLPGLLMAVGGLYLLPYMALPGISAQSEISKIPDHFAEISKTISGAFLLYNDNALLILVFIAMLVLLAPRPRALFILLCGATGILYLLAYVRMGDMRHRGLLLLEIIAAYGIGQTYEDEPIGSYKSLVGQGGRMIAIGFTIITAFLAYQTYAGIRIWNQDIDGNFSGSRDAADFIVSHHLEHRIIIGQPSWAASSVMQYLPAGCKIYYADCQRYGTFIIYDSLYEANQFRFASNYGPYTAEHNFPDSLEHVLLLLNSPITARKFAARWNMIYHTEDEPMKKQESYFIYELRR